MVAPVTDHSEEPAHGPHHQGHVDAAGAGQHARGRHEDAGADDAAHDYAAPDQSRLSIETTDQLEHSIENAVHDDAAPVQETQLRLQPDPLPPLLAQLHHGPAPVLLLAPF